MKENIKEKHFTTQFANRDLIITINKTSCLSNGSCWVRYGDTTVMVHATMSKKQRDDIDFFPLSVEYEEKQYAAGKIPGSFMKREGKPTENSILVSRCIDRSIRPFFPKDMKNEVSIMATVLSTDIDNSPEICAILGVAVSLSISDIPWNGPIVGVNVGLINNEIILNPNKEERKKSDLNLTVSASSEKIAMIEAAANEIDEKTMLNCIKTAHEEIKKIIEFVIQIKKEYGKEKFEYVPFKLPENILNEIENSTENIIDTMIYKIEKKIVRRWLLEEGRRIDNRKMNELRPISCEVDFLPIVHGCGIFTRGQTQSMSILTLGSLLEEQRLDNLDEKQTKRYIHHYNFPPYSVGEAKPKKAPGRREIGHGALAEKALKPVIPDIDEFPYTIRIVSEILSSNGSTSQASICSSTLALMDAGVPIKAPVAGISCGLITKENGEFTTMLDIQGLEDFFGDMDFKVAGTKKGITAIQVDVKIDGLTFEIIGEVFRKTKQARIYIIDNYILNAIKKPRQTVKENSPKIDIISIPIEKIKDVIGSNGRVIQKISVDNNVKIEIQEQGKTYIMGNSLKDIENVKNIIKTIINNPKIGDIVSGTVVRIMPFGAFVEIAPGKEGLLHISKIDFKKIEKVQDILKIGDSVVVKVIEIDTQGRINLSRKDAL